MAIFIQLHRREWTETLSCQDLFKFSHNGNYHSCTQVFSLGGVLEHFCSSHIEQPIQLNGLPYAWQMPQRSSRTFFRAECGTFLPHFLVRVCCTADTNLLPAFGVPLTFNCTASVMCICSPIPKHGKVRVFCAFCRAFGNAQMWKEPRCSYVKTSILLSGPIHT